MTALFATMGIGFLVGILGTGIGGLTVLSASVMSVKRQGLLLGVSGGIMMAVVIWDLWPEAIRMHRFSAMGGGLVGLLFVYIAGLIMNARQSATFNRFTKTGILMGIGIGMHNFPEGLAVGTVHAAARKWQDWAGLAGVMALHNVPEGMVVAATLRLGKVAVARVLSALVLVELPMAVGALLGGLIGRISVRFIGASLGFAAGAMFLLVVKEMIPMGNDLSSPGVTWVGFIIGMLLGLLIVKVI